jgi:hypothetical protein
MFRVEKFIFPICNLCHKSLFTYRINGYKFKNELDLFYIKKNLLIFKNNFEDMEKDFQNICGKDYISLYP